MYELAALEAIQEASRKEAAAAAEKKPEEPVEGLITIDDFRKVELRVAKVTACEAVKKSDKLLCLQLEVGGEQRQVVSGIHSWYEPEDLIGKKLIVVANLKPAVLCGVESNGMLLAGTNNACGCRVVFVDDSVPCGTMIK